MTATDEVDLELLDHLRVQAEQQANYSPPCVEYTTSEVKFGHLFSIVVSHEVGATSEEIAKTAIALVSCLTVKVGDESFVPWRL